MVSLVAFSLRQAKTTSSTLHSPVESGGRKLRITTSWMERLNMRLQPVMVRWQHCFLYFSKALFNGSHRLWKDECALRDSQHLSHESLRISYNSLLISPCVSLRFARIVREGCLFSWTGELVGTYTPKETPKPMPQAWREKKEICKWSTRKPIRLLDRTRKPWRRTHLSRHIGYVAKEKE